MGLNFMDMITDRENNKKSFCNLLSLSELQVPHSKHIKCQNAWHDPGQPVNI